MATRKIADVVITSAGKYLYHHHPSSLWQDFIFLLKLMYCEYIVIFL